MASAFILFGSLGALACGVLGQLTTFRNPNGDVTTRAKLTLMATVLSTIITLIGSWLGERQTSSIARNRQELLLRAVWEQGDHITPSDVVVTVTYLPISLRGEPAPLLMPSECDIEVRMMPASSNKPKDAGVWSAAPIMKDEFWLVARTQTNDRRFFHLGEMPVHAQISRFSDFVGELKLFLRQIHWNGAHVEIHLAAKANSLSPAMLEPLAQTNADFRSKYVALLRRGLMQRYTSLHHDAGITVEPLPIFASATLYIRGRQIAQASGMLTLVTTNVPELRTSVIGKFPIVTVDASAFESFNPSKLSEKESHSAAERMAVATEAVLVLATIALIVAALRVRDARAPGAA